MLQNKKAFTLTEILIALTIIGVVAMLTVPRIMTNVSAKTNRIQLQKTYATISNALRIANTQLDYNLDDILGHTGLQPTTQSFLSKAMDITLVSSGETSAYKFAGAQYDVKDGAVIGLDYSTEGIEKKAAVFKLRDGSYLIIPPEPEYTKRPIGCTKKHPCIAYIDTNGKKGPNEQIQCTKGISSIWTTTETPSSCEVDDSVVTDIYPFVIYGASIQPADSACETVLTND